MRTGRWAGRTLQPQNLPRPKHTPAEIALAIKFFHCEEIELLDPEDIMGLAVPVVCALDRSRPRPPAW